MNKSSLFIPQPEIIRMKNSHRDRFIIFKYFDINTDNQSVNLLGPHIEDMMGL